MEDANARVRGWQEDVGLLLSFLEGFVRERQVVFASSPYLTSRRFYDLCLQHDVRTAGDLRTALGEDVITKLLAKNKEEAALFAQNLHTAAQPFVLNPTAFVVDPTKTGRKWTHSEYGEFWNLVIAKKGRTLYFNEGWQFSNSCTSRNACTSTSPAVYVLLTLWHERWRSPSRGCPPQGLVGSA